MKFFGESIAFPGAVSNRFESDRRHRESVACNFSPEMESGKSRYFHASFPEIERVSFPQRARNDRPRLGRGSWTRFQMMKSHEWKGSLTFTRSRQPEWDGLIVSPPFSLSLFSIPLSLSLLYNKRSVHFVLFFFIAIYQESCNAITLKDRYAFLAELRRKSRTPYRVGGRSRIELCHLAQPKNSGLH